MEQSEIDELQAYINLYFKTKNIITMPTTFYVLERVNSDPTEYVSGLNSSGLPVFDTNRDNAEWSYSLKAVEKYVTDNQLENVKPKSEGGNHPPKPPISA